MLFRTAALLLLAAAAAADPALRGPAAAATGELEHAVHEAALVERATYESDLRAADVPKVDDMPKTVELGKTEEVNPYMTNGATAEALFALFSMVALMICWIECCKAAK